MDEDRARASWEAGPLHRVEEPGDAPRRRRRVVIALAAVAVVLALVAGARTVSRDGGELAVTAELDDPRHPDWLLGRWVGPEFGTVELRSSGEADGHDGCNSFSATWELREGRLEMRPVTSTLAGCAPERRIFDDAFAGTAQVHRGEDAERIELRSSSRSIALRRIQPGGEREAAVPEHGPGVALPPDHPRAGTILGGRSAGVDRVVLSVLGAAPFVSGDACTAHYAAEVEGSGAQRSIRIRAWRPAGSVPDQGCGPAVHRVVVADARGVGRSALVAAHVGAPIVVTDGAAMVTPRWLPDGWRKVDEAPAEHGGWSQWFAASPPVRDADDCPEQPTSEVVVTSGGTEPPPPGAAPAGQRVIGRTEATIHELHPAEDGQGRPTGPVVGRGLHWTTESGRTISVFGTARCVTGTATPLDVLTRMAESLGPIED